MNSEEIFNWLYFLCGIGFIFGLIIFIYQKVWDMAITCLVLGAMILSANYYQLFSQESRFGINHKEETK